MAKLRRSKARNTLIAPEVFAEAVELFRRGLELQRLGADEIGDGYEEKTPEQKEYARIWKRLTWTLLGLVGEAGPLDTYPGMPPSGNDHFQTSIPRALEIRAQLQRKIRRWPT